MKLAHARHQQRINRELQKLPEHKRKFAEKSLQKVLERFYDESDEKVNVVISVMVDAMEKDYYYDVINKIEDAHDRDIEKLADALSDFGLLEMSMVSSQAVNRLRFLDELDLLRQSNTTDEKTIHKALENNLWVLGSEYSLIFSNKTLSKAIDEYLGKKFTGNRANKRPDLFLGTIENREHLLIEFKKPSETIGREAERQALEYRDDLNSVLHNKKINIMIIGGKVDPSISSHYERPDVKFLTFVDVIANSRAKLEWLINELKTERV